MTERSGGANAFLKIPYEALNKTRNWKESTNKKRVLIGIGVIAIVIIVTIAAFSQLGKFVI